MFDNEIKKTNDGSKIFQNDEKLNNLDPECSK